MAQRNRLDRMIVRLWAQRNCLNHAIRLIDGLPKATGYALGADEETSALDRMPTLTISNNIPRLQYSRRTGLGEMDFSISESPALLPASWMDHTSNWTETAVTPLPDGVSEEVELERDNPVSDPQRFFKPELGVTLP